jgi:hypothetical protein
MTILFWKDNFARGSNETILAKIPPDPTGAGGLGLLPFDQVHGLYVPLSTP